MSAPAPPPTLSVVIPSYRRGAELEQALRDLAAQAFAAFEVLVVLQTRPTAAEIAALAGALDARLRLFHLPEPNASRARNVGLAEARGEIVLFLDDDVRIPAPDFLATHLRNFADPALAGVYGQVLEVGQAPTDTPSPGVIETAWGWIRLPANYARRCRTRNGASNNLAVRRDWAVAVGGMDAWFERGARREETEFNLRYTKRFGSLVFDPAASLIHLSAGGGSRGWGPVRRTVPMHHVVGHWYFLVASLRNRTLSPRATVNELRHIAVALLRNPATGADPVGFARNLARAARGLALALGRLAAGPRRLDTTGAGAYESLATPGERRAGAA
jgi:glycosyltransferase involved in cell wall biosynthesis